MTKPKSAQLIYDEDTDGYLCQGSWSIHSVTDLLSELPKLKKSTTSPVIFDGKDIDFFDNAGALALHQCINSLTDRKPVKLVNFTDMQRQLIKLIHDNQENIHYKPVTPKREGFLYALGKQTLFKLQQINGLLTLIGSLSEKLFRLLKTWKRFQIPSVVSNINTTGVQALPIIGLLSFLIGVVLAYQMGLQLETYGATTFIAYLSGMACFREFAPLITAIIVAGRTSSAFTAQIGSMRINEEIDALETMGLSPIELLVIPKLIGLLFVFPLLIFWADVFSLAGAMMLSKFKLSVGYADFLNRVYETVGAKQMFLGLYKAPVFAVLVALVGCFQGFNVESKGNIGSQTTKSVVQSLFLIIIADAAFSILYSWLRL